MYPEINFAMWSVQHGVVRPLTNSNIGSALWGRHRQTDGSMRSKWLVGMLLSVALGLIAAPAQTETLKNAGALVSHVNGSVPFDRVYRVNAHNTYNPNTFPSLEEALDAGVRSIEIDIYGTFAGWGGTAV